MSFGTPLGGILARHTPSDEGDMTARGYDFIDLVVCNLYPFKQLLAKKVHRKQVDKKTRVPLGHNTDRKTRGCVGVVSYSCSSAVFLPFADPLEPLP